MCACVSIKPPNSDKDYRIFNVRVRFCFAVVLHAHTQGEHRYSLIRTTFVESALNFNDREISGWAQNLARNDLKQKYAESTRAESTHKGVN